MLALRAVFFTILMPGTAVVLIPSLLLKGQPPPRLPLLTPSRLAGLFLMAAGLAVLLHCVRGFAVTGRGTLAPIDPPRRMVTRGLYRFVRNPMYVAVVVVLAGEALFFQSRPLAIFAGTAWLVFHLFVVLYEEPHLRDVFGAEYEDYRAAVARWIPKVPPRALPERNS